MAIDYPEQHHSGLVEVGPGDKGFQLRLQRSSKQVMKQPITVSVNAEGEYFVNKKPVNAASLEPELKALIAGANLDQPTVVLRVDASLNVQKLVDILEMGNRLKIRMVMATQAQQAAAK